MSTNIYTRLLLDTKQFDKNLGQSKKNLKSFTLSSKSIFKGVGKIGGYAAAIMGVAKAIHSAMTSNIEFEKSLSSLRALTGVSAKELNYFRAEAVKMAMSSTQSAKDMVESYKLIGSQMPELLKNKEALSATARAAVTLAEAAELDVPTAAKALTGSLNQMGESSLHATKYINILAAASMQGSADIPYLNKAIENAGGAASSVGIKFHELVASVEAIAPRITDAASAGTNLRNIFLTLESASEQNLKPSVVGLSGALENLAAKNLDATGLTKMFGKESVTAAIALLQERDAFEALKTGIVNTETAYEQADINTNNLAGSIKKLDTAWEALANTFVKTNGAFKKAVDYMHELIVGTNKLFMSSGERFAYDHQKDVDKAKGTFTSFIDSGSSPQEALQRTIAAVSMQYPGAGNSNLRKKVKDEAERKWKLAKIRSWNDQAPAAEEKAFQEAEKLYDLSVEETKIKELIVKSLQNLAKEYEKEAAEKVDNKPTVGGDTTITSGGTASALPGTMAELGEQLTKARAQYASATSTEARIAAQKTINELESKRLHLSAIVETSIFQEGRNAPSGSLSKNDGSLASLASRPSMEIKVPSLSPKVKEAADYAQTINMVADSVSDLSHSFAGGSTATMQYFANIISGAAQAAVAIAALIPVKKDEANANMESALSGAAASQSSIPFVGPAMAISSVMALIAAMAAIPKFATGGVVGGSSYFGDKLLARVNSGETILTQRQTRNALSMMGSSPVQIGIDKVRGSDIYLAVKNYMKETGKKL